MVPGDNVQISLETLRERIDDRATQLDIRMEAKYEKWRINGEAVESTNKPHFEFLGEEAFSLELGPNNCAASQESLADA